MPSKASVTGRLSFERRAPEVLVHLVRAFQQGAKVVEADAERDRQANRRPQRIAAADPVPEHEHVLRRDAELGDLLGIGRQRDEVLGDVALVFRVLQEPGARAVRIGHGFLRGEGLGRHQKQRGLGVTRLSASATCEPSTLDTKCKIEIVATIGPQRLAHHDRPEIRAADADVDHRADGLARVAGPGAAAHGLAEDAHVVQGRAHLGHHVLAAHQNGARRKVAQGHVQHRPALGQVDRLAREHLVAHGFHARGARQLAQQRHGLAGDAVLRVVEQQIPEAQREALEAPLDPRRTARAWSSSPACPGAVPTSSKLACRRCSWMVLLAQKLRWCSTVTTLPSASSIRQPRVGQWGRPRACPATRPTDLDIDLSLASIEHPERFPLISRALPQTPAQHAQPPRRRSR
jgi:hypothetical protein